MFNYIIYKKSDTNELPFLLRCVLRRYGIKMNIASRINELLNIVSRDTKLIVCEEDVPLWEQELINSALSPEASLLRYIPNSLEFIDYKNNVKYPLTSLYRKFYKKRVEMFKAPSFVIAKIINKTFSELNLPIVYPGALYLKLFAYKLIKRGIFKASTKNLQQLCLQYNFNYYDVQHQMKKVLKLWFESNINTINYPCITKEHTRKNFNSFLSITWQMFLHIINNPLV